MGDPIAGGRKKFFLCSSRAFAVVEQLEIQPRSGCSDRLERDDPRNVFAVLAFPCNPLIRGLIGDHRVPLFPGAAELCPPLKPVVIEQDHLFDALHKTREVFELSPLAVNPVNGTIKVDGFNYRLHFCHEDQQC